MFYVCLIRAITKIMQRSRITTSFILVLFKEVVPFIIISLKSGYVRQLLHQIELVTRNGLHTEVIDLDCQVYFVIQDGLSLITFGYFLKSSEASCDDIFDLVVYH